MAFTAFRAPSTMWHQRLGHPHFRVFQHIVKTFSLPVSDKLCSSLCTSCQLGKMSKLTLPISSFRSKNILDLVYCDVWGHTTTSFDGYRYFLLCVDHHTRYMWYFPLMQKSDVFTTFTNFVRLVERQFNTKLKSVQTDWGGELRNLTQFFTSNGILHRRSCPHTSEQNGIVERRHRHVVETGLTLLAQSKLPQTFWSFAFQTAVYLINRLPSRLSSNKSPYQLVFQRPPDYSFLRVFGCLCFPYLRPYNQHKIDFRSTPCIFLGYSPSHHGYQCLDQTTHRIYIARHVRFNEHVFPSLTEPSIDPPSSSTAATSFSTIPDPPLAIFDNPSIPTTEPSPPTPPISEPVQTTPIPQTNTTQPTSSPSQPTTPRYRPPHLRPHPKSRKIFDPSANIATTSTVPSEPTSFTVANESAEWRQAMAAELHALHRNGTWSLVPPVPNSNVIDCKWVYRLKTDQHGNLTRHKARLVAKGFLQQSGIDYHETFSPVVKPATIRTVLSLAVSNKWSLKQLDVQNAFLHGDLHETVYMRQPPGFKDPKHPNHVCKLHKSLYGLKQSPRAWFTKLSNVLQHLGFHGSKTDPSLFILNRSGTHVYLLVYVDDIIITGNDPNTVNSIIASLGQQVSLMDMGRLTYFLGIEVLHTSSGLILSQRKYIQELIDRAGLKESKPLATPTNAKTDTITKDDPLMSDPTRYRHCVGALQYATLSRPDIAYAVNRVCQFMHEPHESHWTAVKRIIRYLKGTSQLGLRFTLNSTSTLHAFADSHWGERLVPITAYSNSDWAGCPVDRRSTGGYAIFLGSNLVSWSARKQKTVSRSSTESEYKAIADTVAELIWLKSLLQELGVKLNKPTLWCDNLGATYLSANPMFHARTKHVEVDFHLFREQVNQGNLKVQFIKTDDQIADIFTKPLSTQRFEFLRSMLQVVTRPQLAGEC
ncbi:putative RNA-directed DNA polymerase [Helianthus annuus]|nr:putative RNA-directed DNA polymerase [Helianthus annuus]